MTAVNEPMLSIRDLTIDVNRPDGPVRLVDHFDLAIKAGERVALVGESGSGKSVIARSIMRLAPSLTARGSIRFQGSEVLELSEGQMRKVRGRRIGMVFQEPLSALDPLMTIGDQVMEPLRVDGVPKREAWKRARDLLDDLGVPNAGARMSSYPHEFSGGMRQRVVLALALIGNPDFLIADEPTTALDVRIQKQVMELLDRVARERGLGVLLITHDLAVVADFSDRVTVLYSGRKIHEDAVAAIFDVPAHPYTSGLLVSVPRLTNHPLERLQAIPGALPDPAARPSGCAFRTRCPLAMDICASEPPEQVALPGGGVVACYAYSQGGRAAVKAPWKADVQIRPTDTLADASAVLEVCAANKSFHSFGRDPVAALTDVSVTARRGKTLGLVGESGSGKSTLIRTIMGLERLDSGKVYIDGKDVTGLQGYALRRLRGRMQLVFQDPSGSLNPRMTVGQLVGEGLRVHRVCPVGECAQRIAELLISVGLSESDAVRYPHTFSGGQRQRIAIARALAVKPEILICDEIVSALDVSVQAQVLNLLKDLQAKMNLTIVFAAHDLAVVRQMCDDVAVLERGRVVEADTVNAVFTAPKSAYTKSLLASVPMVDLARHDDTWANQAVEI